MKKFLQISFDLLVGVWVYISVYILILGLWLVILSSLFSPFMIIGLAVLGIGSFHWINFIFSLLLLTVMFYGLPIFIRVSVTIHEFMKHLFYQTHQEF